jgi:hypothetical protein
MGVREGATALLLMPFGVSQDDALTLALLWFAVYATTSLLGGLVYLFGRFPKPQPEGFDAASGDLATSGPPADAALDVPTSGPLVAATTGSVVEAGQRAAA